MSGSEAVGVTTRSLSRSRERPGEGNSCREKANARLLDSINRMTRPPRSADDPYAAAA